MTEQFQNKATAKGITDNSSQPADGTSKLPSKQPGTGELTDQELDKVSGGFLSKLAPSKPTSTTVGEVDDFSFGIE